MLLNTEEVLLSLCDYFYSAQKKAEEEHSRERFGDSIIIELFVMRNDKVRVEIQKENVSHNEPHFHITHSDKIDASISIKDFRILAGNIDRKTMKHMLSKLLPVQHKLLAIWETLNEHDNSIGAEKQISNLFN